MHIAEGVLAPEVLGAGAVLGAAAATLGYRRMKSEDVPRVAVLSAAFFVASLIHVPVGPASVHLVLTGLLGVVLGWASVPAILVALLLQSLFFGFGGLTTLGVNTCVMGGPAVLAWAVFRRGVSSEHGSVRFLSGFAAGALAVALGALLASGALAASGRAFHAAAAVFLSGHVPVMLIEGFVTGAAVSFLSRVRPEVLGGAMPAAGESACG